MVHPDRSHWSNFPSLSLHRQGFLVPAYSLPVFPTSHSADFSAGSQCYSLCGVWLCQWNNGKSYIFSRWISRYILPIPCVKSYSRSLCTYQSHISGPHHTPPCATQLCWDRCSCIPIGAPQPRFMLHCFILQSIALRFAVLYWSRLLLMSSVSIGNSLFHSALYLLGGTLIPITNTTFIRQSTAA